MLTLWDTEADRDASWDALAARRRESQDIQVGDGHVLVEQVAHRGGRLRLLAG